MSFLDDLKQEFESQIIVPIVTNEGNKFQSMDNNNIQVVYGDEDGNLPDLPEITYHNLYPKSYYFHIPGTSEKDFINNKKDILSSSFDSFADAMEKFVTIDEPIQSNPLTSADDLTTASESFGYDHYGSYISLGLSKHSEMTKTILQGRSFVKGNSFPFSWNYLDNLIPFFNHRQRTLSKSIVFHADNSFVLSDIEFSISNDRLWIKFLIGVNSKSCIKVFDIP